MALAAEVPDGTKLAASQVFRYRVLDNIRALDPQLAEDVDTAYVVSQLFEAHPIKQGQLAVAMALDAIHVCMARREQSQAKLGALLESAIPRPTKK